MPRQTVLRELAMHVALAVPEDERAVYVETVLQLDAQPKPEDASAALDDPLCEQTYEELPPEGPQELRDLKKAGANAGPKNDCQHGGPPASQPRIRDPKNAHG
jgi:hypothetical protein